MPSVSYPDPSRRGCPAAKLLIMEPRKVDIIPPETIPTQPPSQVLRPAPDMPNIVDKIASRPLFKVRTFITILSTIIAWIAAHFLGIDGFNIAQAAGADHVLTVGELINLIGSVVAIYFTKNRKPGTVDGTFTTPGG